MSGDIRERYDHLWAGAWGDMQRFGPVHRRQREALVKLIAKLNVKTLLDVGCGSGENLAGLAEAFPNLALTGVDFSAEALTMAAKRVPSAKLQQLNAQTECLNERFDLVMSTQVIEHVP